MTTILGIESTCDETGIGIIKQSKVLANEIASSVDEHVRWGGVIPEIASRAHLQTLQPTLNRALDKAKINLSEIDAIAVSAGPGLMGCLVVGASYAKGLAYALQKPIYAVNHVIAHIYASTIAFKNFPQDFIGLIVSGGHTAILKNINKNITIIGSTTDDAAGECFDKIGRLLDLNYPAGQLIDKMAQNGNDALIKFPKGYTQTKHLENHRFDFSFSGLKTAVARFIEDNNYKLTQKDFRNNICAALAKAVSEVLVDKTIQAAKTFNIKSIVIGGGFSANSQLRNLLIEQGKIANIDIFIPPLDLCTDNGLMIAKLGAILYNQKAKPSKLNFSVNSTMPLEQVAI
ncbi:MAG: tRNA (adenosine(37)-N6)-threonylcarbamoyltransferase complex transferase subunit TsaD [Bifidobacteriaceae bacterium]|jgi:N6-L-threonylcarbamoyladenine synthase|nr:tRNA (adenosine(37)-N6)-threonylcarbamoyltransferase complex transferase subunit TsaD [Bifidobacteriaceae bacterium]